MFALTSSVCFSTCLSVCVGIVLVPLHISCSFLFSPFFPSAFPSFCLPHLHLLLLVSTLTVFNLCVYVFVLSLYVVLFACLYFSHCLSIFLSPSLLCYRFLGCLICLYRFSVSVRLCLSMSVCLSVCLFGYPSVSLPLSVIARDFD